MIISEKQIMLLIQLAQYYSREIKLTEPTLSEPIDELIKTIVNQQSKELKVIDDACNQSGANENTYMCKKCGELF